MRTFRNCAPARAARLLAGAFICALLACGAAAEEPPRPPELETAATNLIAAVSARYAAVSNLSCTVRRLLPGFDAEMISRVVFARGGFLSSETVSPQRRRVVVDGEFAWTKTEGDKKPRKVAFADQSAAQRASVLGAPASPEESLIALDGATGADAAVPDPRFARQVVFAFAGAQEAPGAADRRAVVSLDAEGRIRQIDVFSDEALKWRLSSLSWSAPKEVLPGVWLFGKSETETAVDGNPVKVVTRFDGIKVNTPLDESVFDAAHVFGKASGL